MEPKRSDELRDARQALLERSDLTGAELRAALTSLADSWLAKRLADVDNVALVAVGGYGRREPAPGSDLDLLLLHDGRADDVKSIADGVWYPLWDSGIGLDHSVRTVSEAVDVAASDLKAALGLLDARHVAGNSALTEELRSAVFTRWRISNYEVRPWVKGVAGTAQDSIVIGDYFYEEIQIAKH